MIGTSDRSQLERRARGYAETLGGVVPSPNGTGPSFASALATANDGAPQGHDSRDTLTTWTKALELARAGGGTARITLSTASGEPVDLRVSVRAGRVTVLAHVTSRAAESAIRAMQETIARSLAEAGLCLHQLHVRQPGKTQAHLRAHLKRHATLPQRHEREREEMP